MRINLRTLAAGAALTLIACQEPTAPTVPAPSFDFAYDFTAAYHITGEGYYTIPGPVNVRFRVNAVVSADGRALGLFRDIATEAGVSFRGRVTCVAVDPVERRVWIGGVVTQNESTDSALQTAIHQPGQDVWFRALDTGLGDVVDRRTFLGFRGAAGFLTSADYCAGRPWPAANARTWPVTGHLEIKEGDRD